MHSMTRWCNPIGWLQADCVVKRHGFRSFLRKQVSLAIANLPCPNDQTTTCEVYSSACWKCPALDAVAPDTNMRRCCRSIATEAAKKEVQRTVLGVVQPGDTIPVPYGWQRAGTAAYTFYQDCNCLLRDEESTWARTSRHISTCDLGGVANMYSRHVYAQVLGKPCRHTQGI